MNPYASNEAATATAAAAAAAAAAASVPPLSAEQQARGMDFVSGPGQPRLQLWQFLLEILNKEEFGSIIRWTGVEPGEFKVIETEEVARLWGLRKGRPNMNYDKLSRSLRYYYDKGILEKVPGQRLVYKFDSDLKNRQEQFARLPRTPSEVATTPTTPLTPMSPFLMGGSAANIADSRFRMVHLSPPPKKAKLSQSATPQDVEARSPEAARIYEKALAEGHKTMRRARLFLFGPPRSGKTSLKRALLGQLFNPMEESTVAVECSTNACVIEPEQRRPWKTRDQRAFKTREYEKEIAKYVAKELKRKRGGGADPPVAMETTKESAASPAPIPEDIVTRIVTALRTQESTSTSSALATARNEDQTVINIWDMGGQALHRVLQTSLYTNRAIYALVVDVSLDFDAPAPSHFVQGNRDVILDENKGETYLDQIVQNVDAVYSATSGDNDVDDDEEHPVIIVVGTRKDKITNPDVVKEKWVHLSEAFSKKPYASWISTYVVVNLTTRDDEGVEDIRVIVDEMTRRHFAVDVPFRWMKFDKAMDTVRRQNVFYATLDDVARIAADECGVTDKTEVTSMLTYYHDQGLLLHYRRCVQLGDIIVTKPQWLIGAIKRLLEIHLPIQGSAANGGSADSSNTGNAGDTGPFQDSWQRLHAEGVLEESLIDHVWSDYARNKLLLLAIAEQMDLVAPRLQRDGTTPTAYYMPAMLHIKPDHEEFCESLSAERDSEVLAFRFHGDMHVPLDFFSRLLVRCLQLCPFHPGLFRTCARFEFDSDHDLVLLACRDHIKFVVQGTQYGAPPQASRPSASVCMEILRFLLATMNELQRQWMPGLKFDLAARHPNASTQGKSEWIQLPDTKDSDWVAKRKIPTNEEDSDPVVPSNALLLWFENPEMDRKKLSDEVQIGLAQRFDRLQDGGKCWRLLATYLGFSHSEIRELSFVESSPCLAMLNAWARREMSSLERLKEKVKLLGSDELLDCL